MSKAGKPIIIEGVKVTPKWNWSKDYTEYTRRRHRGIHHVYYWSGGGVSGVYQEFAAYPRLDKSGRGAYMYRNTDTKRGIPQGSALTPE